MKNYKFDDRSRQILMLVGKSNNQINIAKQLNISKEVVFYRINTLIRHNYLIKTKKGIISELILTQKGVKALTEFNQPVINPLTNQTLRIHSLAICFELKDRLSSDGPQRLLQSKGIMESASGLKNQLSAYTQDALLTPSSLIIYLPELSFSISTDPRLAIQPYIPMAIEKAIKYEQQLGIKLKRLDKDTLSAKIVMNHNANTDNAVAREVLNRLKAFEVRDETGRLRLIVDNSNNIPEFEAVDAIFGIEDITKAQDFYLATLEGRFDYRKEQEARREITLILKEYGQKLNAHIPVLEGMKIEQNEARKERAINMKILKKILEQLNQRHL